MPGIVGLVIPMPGAPPVGVAPMPGPPGIPGIAGLVPPGCC